MLKLVVDTNVVISALLKPESNPALIMSLILRGDCRLCVTEKIFSEYEEVSGRGKFKRLDQASVREFLSMLRRKALWIVPKVTIDDMAKDPEDNAFLECALESKADFLITGNVHHFPEKKFHRTSILTPAEFVSYAVKIIK
ncbi:MAG: putative toxin-antitoxin system toxin component, PIN family [Deltaproteobacteria bacterium RBG_13_47_9]|nr:MAG: putative toxin-antitoxin system toxin component, PIN family [Deltaproteobacteria bacterium RBG_13_47_9]